MDQTALDKAFQALTNYDHGGDRAALMPIDSAVAGSGDAAARKDVERRLAAMLSSSASAVAKDYVCRQLSLIGSADSVPALAGLLGDKSLGHIARFALERMPCPEAVQAMRAALPSLQGAQKAGAVSSLGARHDSSSVPALSAALADPDATVAQAAAAALGEIGTAEAAGALESPRNAAIRLAVADARLACAERLLAEGKKAEALAIYKSLAGPTQPKHVRVAATRGALAAAK